ncbi:hypothetical protein LCGC14_0442350 [marine sediment metagenome]|uniref:Uncharacterized protein n=1 Tax=marine sediment metagenome TaxID=412755 RepID=A0A0F9SK46_9ZZZZ
MGSDIVRVEIHKNLKEVLENLRVSIATDMKLQFGLDEISVPRTLSSQILAAKHRGQKEINIKIRKTGVGRGVLELL